MRSLPQGPHAETSAADEAISVDILVAEKGQSNQTGNISSVHSTSCQFCNPELLESAVCSFIGRIPDSNSASLLLLRQSSQLTVQHPSYSWIKNELTAVYLKEDRLIIHSKIPF